MDQLFIFLLYFYIQDKYLKLIIKIGIENKNKVLS